MNIAISRNALCLATASSLCLLAASPGLAQQIDEASVRKQLAESVKTDPALRGAWVQIHRPADGGPITAAVTVDKSRSRAQQAAVNRLLAGLLSSRKYVVQRPVRELPLTQLLRHLQYDIETLPALAGSVIEDAYYELQGTLPGKPDKLVLVLRGRIAQSAGSESLIRDSIVKECKRLLKESKDWPGSSSEIPDFTPNSKGLDEVRGSGSAALAFFNRGIGQYVGREYSAAARSFASAIVEDPSSPAYRYWQIAAEIGAGNKDRAYRLLRPLLQAERSATPYEHVLWMAGTLERVQGPVRWTLEELKLKAWKDVEIGLPPSR